MNVARPTLAFSVTASVLFGVGGLILIWLLPLALGPDLFGAAGVAIAVLMMACAVIGFRAQKRAAAWQALGVGGGVFASAAAALIFYMTLP